VITKDAHSCFRGGGKYEKLKITLKAEYPIRSVQFQLSFPNISFLLFKGKSRWGLSPLWSEFSLDVREFDELTLGMLREEIPSRVQQLEDYIYTQVGSI